MATSFLNLSPPPVSAPEVETHGERRKARNVITEPVGYVDRRPLNERTPLPQSPRETRNEEPVLHHSIRNDDSDKKDNGLSWRQTGLSIATAALVAFLVAYVAKNPDMNQEYHDLKDQIADARKEFNSKLEGINERFDELEAANAKPCPAVATHHVIRRHSINQSASSRELNMLRKQVDANSNKIDTLDKEIGALRNEVGHLGQQMAQQDNGPGPGTAPMPQQDYGYMPQIQPPPPIFINPSYPLYYPPGPGFWYGRPYGFGHGYGGYRGGFGGNGGYGYGGHGYGNGGGWSHGGGGHMGGGGMRGGSRGGRR